MLPEQARGPIYGLFVENKGYTDLHITDKGAFATKTEAPVQEDSDGKNICLVCGESKEKLYQQNTCKVCLVKLFDKYIKIINNLRKEETEPPRKRNDNGGPEILTDLFQ